MPSNPAFTPTPVPDWRSRTRVTLPVPAATVKRGVKSWESLTSEGPAESRISSLSPTRVSHPTCPWMPISVRWWSDDSTITVRKRSKKIGSGIDAVAVLGPLLRKTETPAPTSSSGPAR